MGVLFWQVVRLWDSFKHTGLNGNHVCMVFEPMGPNLLALIKHYNYRGIPMDLVRCITRQVCVFCMRACSCASACVSCMCENVGVCVVMSKQCSRLNVRSCILCASMSVCRVW